MRAFPRLQTKRLLLRAFVPDDGPVVDRLAGAREVADTTLSIPHPYPVGGGAEWIATHPGAWARSSSVALAICLAEGDGEPIGTVSLVVDPAHRHGELGYWVGRAWWGAGYATEAAGAVTDFGFRELGLHRILGRHFTRSPASGRVMQKLGMQFEGIARDAYLRWGKFEDVAGYGILETEWRGSPVGDSYGSPGR